MKTFIKHIKKATEAGSKSKYIQIIKPFRNEWFFYCSKMSFSDTIIAYTSLK